MERPATRPQPASARVRLGTRYRLGALLIGITVLVGFVVFGDRTPTGLTEALVASVAAGIMVVLVPTRPLVAFGMLVLLASLSKITLDLGVGRARIEQPSILAAGLALILTRGWPRMEEIRPAGIVVAALAAYLGVLTLSSILFAPDFRTSARLILWTAMSMFGGAVAFALLMRVPRGGEKWFTATGAVHASVGLAIAVLFLLAGPTGIPGMQVNPEELPKVAGLAWEANLYGSLLGAMAPFALERFRTRPNLATAAVAGLIIVALGLSVTRGAYLGLAAGLVAYVFLLWYRSATRHVGSVLGIIALSVILAPAVATVLLPFSRVPVASGGTTTPTPAAIASGGTTTPTPAAIASGGTTTPTPAAIASGGTTTSPTPGPISLTDTLSFRLARVPMALADLRQSPIIGLGAATFSQRHERADMKSQADYLGILAVVTLYESGIAGAAALGLALVLVLWKLFEISRYEAGLAGAFTGSIVSLLVAYQSTNALFFSINWLIVGAALALVVRTRRHIVVPADAIGGLGTGGTENGGTRIARPRPAPHSTNTSTVQRRLGAVILGTVMQRPIQATSGFVAAGLGGPRKR